MNISPEKYLETFDKINNKFGVRTIDLSSYASSPKTNFAILKDKKLQGGFSEFNISSTNYRHVIPEVIGKVILSLNSKTQTFYPTVITPLKNNNSTSSLLVTICKSPFMPNGSFNAQNFALSLKAQTESNEFGAHGSGEFALEQGHFGGILLSSKDSIVAKGLNNKKTADPTLDALLRGGVNGMSEKFAANGMVPSMTVSRVEDFSRAGRALSFYWHESLERNGNPQAVDYPNASKLLLGAGFLAIGNAGIEQAKRTVDKLIG